MTSDEYVKKRLAEKKKNNPKEYARVGKSKPAFVENKKSKKKK